MALTAHTRLGPYEILAPIGAGGMGEVYKANDTRLDRAVAIKILPAHFAESAERRQRFEREAKAISQLNHPHICTLYDVGEQDGIHYLVMEYIEGETLAERLKKGALPLDKAIEYGIQMADGLAKAHRAGIVHRDLKPANIMLTKLGVKLLDFGLAKPIEPHAAVDGSDAPTRQKNLTEPRTIVGTLQYMAPEQLEGDDVDARTDLFAFGAVLYRDGHGKEGFRGREPSELDHRHHELGAAAAFGDVPVIAVRVGSSGRAVLDQGSRGADAKLARRHVAAPVDRGREHAGAPNGSAAVQACLAHSGDRAHRRRDRPLGLESRAHPSAP